MALTILVHARLVPVYFCGFDDFTNARRAALDDAVEPVRIFTTTHFGSAKYRPLSRAATYATEILEGPPALAHRLRNLACHLAAVAAVYAIALALHAPPEAAAVAATLFGVSPMSHQTVAAAIFTIDLAYAAMLWSLASFLFAYERARSAAWLFASLGLALVALFTYESTIAVFGCFAGHLLLRARGGTPPAAGWGRFLAALAAGTVLVLLAFAAVRRSVVVGRLPLTPLPTILVNAALYGGALASPVDPVSLSWIAGTPLPSELVRDHAVTLAVAFGILASVGAVAAARASSRWRPASIAAVPWATVVWAASAIPLALAPFLLFSDHPSETYLYAPAAFFALAWTLVLQALLPRRAFRAVAVGTILLAAAASTMRTERVRACGETAARTLAQLPLDRWRTGAPRVRLADAPGIAPMRRFGLYGYRGLATIDPREEHWNALEAALQLATGNRELRASVVDGDALRPGCAPRDFCGWVAADGTVTAATPRGAADSGRGTSRSDRSIP